MLTARLLAGSAAGAATLAYYQSQKPSTPKVVLGAKQRSAVVRRPPRARLPPRRAESHAATALPSPDTRRP